MKTIVLFPSVEEATPYLLTEPRTTVFITGTDPAEMAAGTVRAIRARKPRLAILAGTAAACDDRLPPGSVVEVVSERMDGSTREYTATGPETGLPEVRAVTFAGDLFSGAGDCKSDILQTGCKTPRTEADSLPLVAEREGAAFFAVCEAMETACCQIRAVTHRCAETPDEEQTRTALRSLTEALTDTLTQITENYE